MIKKVIFLGAAFSLAGCSSSVDVMPSSMPASDIIANRSIKTPTTYSFSSDMMDKTTTVTCGAYTYNLNLGRPAVETIRKAISVGFVNATENPQAQPTGYHIRVDMDDADAHYSIMPGFWTANINTHVEMTANVSVTDGTGKEIAKAEITGIGSNEYNGACPQLGKGIEPAAEKAIKRLGSDFVFKVINNNSLQ